MKKYFGTDGIRGEALIDITPQLVKKVAHALGCFKINTCIVGMDTRESSKVLKDALVEGLKDVGFYVYDLNITTTPCLIYLSKYYNSIGVMITGSHNTYEKSGIKIAVKGIKLNDEQALVLESNMGKNIPVYGAPLPFFSIYPYTKLLKSFKIASNYKIAFDFSNGSLTNLYREILSYYDFRKTVVANAPDGKNINLKCGSGYLANVKSIVKLESCDYGFAFDGDGDRVIITDKKGNVYDGDKITYVLANYYKNNKKLDNNLVVVSEDSNPGLKLSLEKEEINVVTSGVGDKNVSVKLNEVKGSLGGEPYGHIILSRLSSGGDGLLTSLMILEVLSETNRTLEKLTENLELYGIIRKKYRTYDERYVETEQFQKEIERIKSELPEENSVLIVRVSDDEKVLNVVISTGDSFLDKSILKEIENFAQASE